jgi:hypothetical protein
MTNCDVRPATAEDITAWFGGPPPYTCKAFVMEVDGKLEAMYGLKFAGGEVACFSTLTEVARKHKRAVVEGIRLLRKELDKHPYVVAYATKGEPTAEGFIRHVGFKHVGTAFWGEEVYCYE